MSEPGSLEHVTALLTAPGAPFEMEDIDVRGVALRGWRHAPPSLREILVASRAHGDAEFLVYDGAAPGAVPGPFDRLTFIRHFDAAATFANRLVDSYGIAQGDRVSIAMRNFPEWSVAFWGAAAAGAVIVPLNAWGTGPELAYGLADSGSRVLICDLDRAERIEPHRRDLPDLHDVMVVRHGSAELPGTAVAFDAAVGDVRHDVQLPDVDIGPDDHATIFYTSGTTGQPKGALGTHRNICTNLVSLGFCAARSAARSTSPTDQPVTDPPPRNIYLLSVPFFHVTGCHSVLVATMAAGGEIVIMHRWDAERALQLIERERVTLFGGVPAMAWQVLEHPEFGRYDLSSVKAISYGGAPAAPELVRRLEVMFPGRTPSNGYGLTETSSVTTMNGGLDYRRKPDSVGVPVPVCDVKVVDADGTGVPEGEVGELWIKGPNVVEGYWNKQEATAAAISHGWLHSGDVARIDDEGFVHIVDRAKDMIIRGGENVYCVEVEAALFEHPAVTDAAAIGIPHRVLGEEVGAVVHLAPGTSATEDELRAFAAERIASFKVPVRVWIKDDPLPRNANGKIVKRDLKAELLALIES